MSMHAIVHQIEDALFWGDDDVPERLYVALTAAQTLANTVIAYTDANDLDDAPCSEYTRMAVCIADVLVELQPSAYDNPLMYACCLRDMAAVLTTCSSRIYMETIA